MKIVSSEAHYIVLKILVSVNFLDFYICLFKGKITPFAWWKESVFAETYT